MVSAKRDAKLTANRSHLNEAPRRYNCSPDNLCPRCAMMKVVQYRFAIFRKTFGRDPLPNEPLFFRSTGSVAMAVDRAEAVDQLSIAARATQVRLDGLLSFLNLDSSQSN